MAIRRQVVMGASGDKILKIISSGKVPRARDNTTYLSGGTDQGEVFMHGADERRRQCYAVLIEVTLPDEGVLHTSTPGVRNTIHVVADHDVKARVLRMYVRYGRAPNFGFTELQGTSRIQRYLQQEYRDVNDLLEG